MSHFEAKPILTQSQLLVLCPSCLHEVHPIEFCECDDCGSLFCGKASNGCKAVCLCDSYGIPYNDDQYVAVPDEAEIRKQAS